MWSVGLLVFFFVSFVFCDDFVESAVVDGLLDVFEVCDVDDAGLVPMEPFSFRFEDCVAVASVPVLIIPLHVFPEVECVVSCFS